MARKKLLLIVLYRTLVKKPIEFGKLTIKSVGGFQLNLL
jgi:hypothetical protein